MQEKKKNKLVFTVKDVEYAVKRPTVKDEDEAQKVWNRRFRDALESGAVLAQKADVVAKEQGLWNDEVEEKVKSLEKELRETRKLIVTGGFKKSKGKELSLKCFKLSNEIDELNLGRNAVVQNSAEMQAQNARFNKLVSLVTVYNSGEKEGEPYCKDYEDYLEKQDDEVILKASVELMYLLNSSLDKDRVKKLPENKFLLDNGFAKYDDGKVRWVNEKGQYTDQDGRLVNEDGRFVNENGELVDRDGNMVDEDGNLVWTGKPVD